MKKGLILFAVFIFSFVLVSAQLPTNLQSGLVSYWNFDETNNGNTATDSIGNNGGSINGASRVDEDISGRALSFDGNGDYIQIPNDASLQTDSFTINLWVKSNEASAGNPDDTDSNATTYNGIIGKHRCNVDSNSFVIIQRGSEIIVQVYNINGIIEEGNSYWYTLKTPSSGIYNQWGMLTLTIQKNGKASMYLNGALVDSASIGNFNGDRNNNHLLIGAGQYGNANNDPDNPYCANIFGDTDGPVQFWNGLIDEVGYWDKALTGNEINEIYEFYTTPPTPIETLNTTYWANLIDANEILTTADSGDTVLMVVGGDNLLGKSIDYTIEEFGDGAVWWNPLTWFNLVKTWSESGVISGASVEPVTIQVTGGILRFKAKVVSTSVTSSSSNLTIRTTQNSAPVANITSPTSIQRYSIGTPIWFNHTSYDVDDLLNITWDFGDEQMANTALNYSLTLTPNSGNVQHTYGVGGKPYSVKLTAKEMTRVGKDTSILKIQVFQPGVNVFPIIVSPENGAASGDGWIKFNASASFVANCSIDMTPYNFTAGDLKCVYLHAPYNPTEDTQGYTLDFNWTIPDSEQIIYRNESIFSYRFMSTGQHKVTLELTYED